MGPASRAKFNELLSSVDRPGMSDLSNWLGDEGFYFSPASTKFHGNYEGGLLMHSLNVYDTLKTMSNSLNMPLDKDSLIICTLPFIL